MSVQAWKHVTPYLLFSCVVFLQGALLFGIDTGSFGSLQALPSFLRRFGVESSGAYVLPATRKSLMNSLPWVGKIVGCMSAEPLIERAGYKRAMYVVGVVQIVGLIIEMTAHHWAQFTVGRIVAYAAVGIVENAVPAYNAEIAPAATRGVLAGGIMTITALGNLWGAGMSRAYAKETSARGWLIPVGVQFIPSVLILLLVPFAPDSPRWLVLRGRKSEAKAVLDKIRPQSDVDSGATAAETDALEQAIVEARTQHDTGAWLDLFRGNYLRRTWICATVFVFEQMNGNQFVLSYGATFYVQQGLGAKSFTYNIVGQVVGLVGCALGVLSTDFTGRRPLLIGGAFLTAFFLFLASGLGSLPDITQVQTNTMLACFMIIPATCRISATNNAFLTGAEIGGVQMRKKTMSFGTTMDVIAAFLVTFVTPYLLPSMGVKIGWIFGSVALLSCIWGILFFPELKGRSLEEVDELFEARLHAWQFNKYETHGTGRLLAALENEGHVSGNKFEPEQVPSSATAKDVV